MSEYWKSTPKYWCKHCKTYVRDTKLEKQNHDATPKHQGNLKRFVRDLHRGHEKDERDKERAKSEVARLNGLVAGSGPSSSSSSSSSGFGRGPPPSVPKPQATTSQRKQQLAQLAEMGVSIPEEFRGEMAMVGEWQVTSERVIDSADNGEKRPEAIGFGIRKRAVEDDGEAEAAAQAKKKRWGSTFRTHPGGDDDLDLDQLLSSSTGKKKTTVGSFIKQEDSTVDQDIKVAIKTESDGQDTLEFSIKAEPSEEEVKFPDNKEGLQGIDDKGEIDNPAEGITFKKRSKSKNIRQK